MTRTGVARRTDAYLFFLDPVLAHWPDGTLIFMLDHASVQRAFEAKRRALAQRRVRFVFEPTDAPWLNLSEPCWNRLRSLASSALALRAWPPMVQAIDEAMLYWLDHRHPFTRSKAA